MDQATLRLSSPVASHSSTFGRSIEQFRKSFSRRLSSRARKSDTQIHGQSATQISVVIPTCGRPQLLENCLRCLVEQSFEKNFYEIIVVSDGFDDKTKNIVNEFKQSHPAIYYLYLTEKKGLAAARNMGWQRGWGKVVAFTDDDCLPDKDWLASLYKIYNGEEEIAYSGAVRVPLSSHPTDYERNTSNREIAEFVTANCCCTKMALEKVGGFDERFSMAWREDSDLEFKLIRENIPVIKVEDALVVHPVRQANWGVSIKEQKKRIFNALLYKKFPDLYRKKIQASRPWNYYMVAVAFLCALLSFFLQIKWLVLVFGVCWAGLTVKFISTRLSRTTKTFSHIIEMVVTSIVIPFVSVFWQFYGAIKYRTFFL